MMKYHGTPRRSPDPDVKEWLEGELELRNIDPPSTYARYIISILVNNHMDEEDYYMGRELSRLGPRTRALKRRITRNKTMSPRSMAIDVLKNAASAACGNLHVLIDETICRLNRMAIEREIAKNTPEEAPAKKATHHQLFDSPAKLYYNAFPKLGQRPKQSPPQTERDMPEGFFTPKTKRAVPEPPPPSPSRFPRRVYWKYVNQEELRERWNRIPSTTSLIQPEQSWVLQPIPVDRSSMLRGPGRRLNDLLSAFYIPSLEERYQCLLRHDEEASAFRRFAPNRYYVPPAPPIPKPNACRRISFDDNEDLLTSPRTHFVPIERNFGPDGATFDVASQPNTVNYDRSPSGGLRLGTRRYSRFNNDRVETGVAVMFEVRGEDKAVQANTEEILGATAAVDATAAATVDATQAAAVDAGPRPRIISQFTRYNVELEFGCRVLPGETMTFEENMNVNGGPTLLIPAYMPCPCTIITGDIWGICDCPETARILPQPQITRRSGEEYAELWSSVDRDGDDLLEHLDAEIQWLRLCDIYEGEDNRIYTELSMEGSALPRRMPHMQA